MVIVYLILINYLFNYLIMSLFTYCIRVWGVAAYTKYLGQIDRLLRRAFRFGYIQHETSIQQVVKDRDLRLRKGIVGTPSHSLQDLSPPPHFFKGEGSTQLAASLHGLMC